MNRRMPKLIAKPSRETCDVRVGASDSTEGKTVAAVVGGIGGGAVGYFMWSKTIGAVIGFGAGGALAGWLLETVRQAAGPINVGALFSRPKPIALAAPDVGEMTRCITAARAAVPPGGDSDGVVLHAAWGCLIRGGVAPSTPPSLFTKMFFDCAMKKRDELRAAHPGQALFPSDYDIALCALQAAKALAASRSPILTLSPTSRAA